MYDCGLKWYQRSQKPIPGPILIRKEFRFLVSVVYKTDDTNFSLKISSPWFQGVMESLHSHRANKRFRLISKNPHPLSLPHKNKGTMDYTEIFTSGIHHATTTSITKFLPKLYFLWFKHTKMVLTNQKLGMHLHSSQHIRNWNLIINKWLRIKLLTQETVKRILC